MGEGKIILSLLFCNPKYNSKIAKMTNTMPLNGFPDIHAKILTENSGKLNNAEINLFAGLQPNSNAMMKI